MRLKMQTADALFSVMNVLDQDEKIDLDDKTRLRLAININLLRPHVEAYGKVVTRLRADTFSDGKMDGVKALAFERRVTDLADEEIDAELPLKMFKQADFRLATNKRITGARLAMMAPLIKDFGEGVEDA